MTKKVLEKELSKLLKTFYNNKETFIYVKCLDLYNDYQPNRGDEVVTYKYTVNITINDKAYTYEGWCYDDDLDSLAVGIYSHWLLNNYKIYDGPSSAWYNMYVGYGNLVDKEKRK